MDFKRVASTNKYNKINSFKILKKILGFQWAKILESYSKEIIE
ncbi:hypothetical Protein pso3_10390 [Candidatus Phytoplasma solani]